MHDSARSRYRDHCSLQSSIPFFLRAWWLDLVCGRTGWDCVLLEQNKQLVAAWPYVRLDVRKHTAITQPKLNPYLGVWINYPHNMKGTRKISYDNKIIPQLAESLFELGITSFSQGMHPGMTNWLPFHWLGFTQTTRYTYVLPPASDEEAALARLEPQTRRDIKTAKQHFEIRREVDPDQFYDIYADVFTSRNMSPPYSRKTVHAITGQCITAGKGGFVGAYEKDGSLASGAFLVYDQGAFYYLFGAMRQHSQPSAPGAQALCLWDGILEATRKQLVFDFEGSMLKGVEHFFRSFGARQLPYFRIEWTAPSLLRRQALHRLLKWR